MRIKFWHRWPTSTEISAGWYSSSPHVDIMGWFLGYTGFYSWPFAADDKWCKCFLRMKQVILVLDAVNPVANLVEQMTPQYKIIDEENELRWVTQLLPSRAEVGGIEFRAPSNFTDIISVVEVWFDCELEGDLLWTWDGLTTFPPGLMCLNGL